MNADQFVRMFGNNNNKQTKIRYAKVDPNYTSGRPSLIFDGETTPTIKKYMFLSSYQPRPNDRVAVIDSFILGKVGDVYDDETDGEYAPVDHTHGDNYRNTISYYEVGGVQIDPNTTQYPVILTAHANCPTNVEFWYIETFFYAALNGNRSQLAISYNRTTPAMFIRSYFNGVWTNWVQL